MTAQLLAWIALGIMASIGIGFLITFWRAERRHRVARRRLWEPKRPSQWRGR